MTWQPPEISGGSTGKFGALQKATVATDGYIWGWAIIPPWPAIW